VIGNVYGSYGGGTIPSETNIHLIPQFAGWLDCHLKSAGGRWTESGWVYDAISSPCIDAGDPSDDVGDETIPNGDRINMGAYGGTIHASKTPGTGLTLPGTVDKLTIQGGHKQISLSWDDPNYTGGLPITAYNIYRGPSAGELTFYDEVGGGELSFIDTNVQNRTEYFYTISTVNDVGEGAQASPISYTAQWNKFDFNGDGVINLIDWAMFIQEWLWQAAWRSQ